MPIEFANCTTSTAGTWGLWTTATTTITYATNSAWNSWTSGNANTVTFTGNYLPAEPTEEERAQQRERAERQRVEAQERTDRERIARERARETLQQVLDGEQWERWEREQQFELITQSGRRYRIRRGVSGNVRLIEDGQEAEALCAHPPTGVYSDDRRDYLGALPVEDVVIAQVLALQADEESFRRVANITDYRNRSAPRVHAAA